MGLSLASIPVTHRAAIASVGAAALGALGFELSAIPDRYPGASPILLIGHCALAAAFLVLVARKLRSQQSWTFNWNVRVPNLVQACVQSSIYVYMSFHSQWIGEYAPWIAYQLCFAFLLDVLISLWKHGEYRIGFSVFPIVFSTNLFIWFRPEFFYLQLVMISVGVLSKHAITRVVNGQRSHIFNPSVVGMLFGTFWVLSFGTHYAYFSELVYSYNYSRPGIFLHILLAGSISQWIGKIVPVSAGAVLTLFALDHAVLGAFGIPLTNQWIDPSVMVGVTLLVTDPATTPKTNWGKFLFGICYGLSILTAYGVLCYFQLVGYHAKILAVPLLNWFAPRFDRLRSPFNWKPSQIHQSVAYVLMFAAFLKISYPERSRFSALGLLGGAQWAWRNRR